MKKAPEHPQVLTIPSEFPLQIKRICNHGSRRIHRHDFSELVIVFQGRSAHLTDEGSYNISVGDVFVVSGIIEKRCYVLAGMVVAVVAAEITEQAVGNTMIQAELIARRILNNL